MVKITEKEIVEIRKKAEKEFPDDPALQQVHIARKIIVREAEMEGLNFIQYIKTFTGVDKYIRQKQGD